MKKRNETRTVVEEEGRGVCVAQSAAHALALLQTAAGPKEKRLALGLEETSANTFGAMLVRRLRKGEEEPIGLDGPMGQRMGLAWGVRCGTWDVVCGMWSDSPT